MLTAIWALVIFTGILAAVTGYYTYISYNVDKSSEEQTKAAGKLTEAIVRLRSTEKHLRVTEEDNGTKRPDRDPRKGFKPW